MKNFKEIYVTDLTKTKTYRELNEEDRFRMQFSRPLDLVSSYKGLYEKINKR
jgi:hypothetical protein